MVRVVWTKTAKQQFKSIVEYIKKDSTQNGQKVKEEVLSSVNRLTSFPERYPLDKYKPNNQGNIRAFEIYKYRVAYEVTATDIIILRIRSTHQEPREY